MSTKANSFHLICYLKRYKNEEESTTDTMQLKEDFTQRSCMYHMVSITRHIHMQKAKEKKIHPGKLIYFPLNRPVFHLHFICTLWTCKVLYTLSSLLCVLERLKKERASLQMGLH